MTPWTINCQTPLFMEFSRHQCWSWLPFPTLEDLPNPGIEPKSLHLLHWQTDSLTLCHPGSTAVAAKSLQSCLTLCDPIDGSPPGSPVPGILQARTLEWVAISFSNAWKWKVKVKSLSHVWPLATPWNAAYQAPVHGSFQARVLEWVAISFSTWEAQIAFKQVLNFESNFLSLYMEKIIYLRQ